MADTAWSWAPPAGETLAFRAIVHAVTWDGDRTLRMYDNDTRRLVRTVERDGLVDDRAAGVAAMRWIMAVSDGAERAVV